MERDSLSNTIIVAVSLCLVCSTLVSVAAVGLRDMQNANRVLDKKKNILAAAGLYDPKQGTDIDAVFGQRIVDRIIDLETARM